MGSSLITVSVVAAGLLMVGLATWRPAAACALLALLVPLTGGIARNTLIPFLRPSEALAVVVLAGLFLNYLALRRRLVFVGLDLVVLTFVLAEVLIPLSMLVVRQVHADLETWRTILGPFQYLAVYVLFSRCEPSQAGLRAILNCAMAASIVVAAVAVLEVISPGFHNVVASYYQESPTPSWDPVYRPSSLVTHYSAVAGFAVLTGSLALALAVARHPGFPAWWLWVVVLANAGGLLISQTWAPLVALPFVFGAVLVFGRGIPWRSVIGVTATLFAALAVGVILLWPVFGSRIEQQQVFTNTGGIVIPTTLGTRLRYWQEFFIPAAAENFWFGTGTSTVAGGYPTPSDVPEQLTKFIDNEYLYEILRAGIFALLLMLAVFVALGWASWRERSSVNPSARALGATCLASVLTLVITGFTSEYLTFSALTQLFWMLVGLLVAVRADPAIAAAKDEPAWPEPWPSGLREARAAGV
jgi:hypothetical protein